MGDQITVNVRRFDPEHDATGHLEAFSLPKDVIDGMTIVTALGYIQENLDPTLAFYYSCELGRCRGCLMDVNGEATFTCTTPVEDGLVIEPLAHLPVIRDLVVKFLLTKLHVDEDACTGCGLCVQACPMDIYEISVSDGVAAVKDGTKTGFLGRADAVDCIGCSRCEKICPVGAIEVVRLDTNSRTVS
ncbi:MAG: 2Fe-2S iron-sulfur cluster-binding protein [Actinobacteria bacterium]|nr:2Fe-2S iron-sulfur cluster-binding protein [Actinomycetota bacterium]